LAKKVRTDIKCNFTGKRRKKRNDDAIGKKEGGIRKTRGSAYYRFQSRGGGNCYEARGKVVGEMGERKGRRILKKNNKEEERKRTAHNLFSQNGLWGEKKVMYIPICGKTKKGGEDPSKKGVKRMGEQRSD